MGRMSALAQVTGALGRAGSGDPKPLVSHAQATMPIDRQFAVTRKFSCRLVKCPRVCVCARVGFPFPFYSEVIKFYGFLLSSRIPGAPWMVRADGRRVEGWMIGRRGGRGTGGREPSSWYLTLEPSDKLSVLQYMCMCSYYRLRWKWTPNPGYFIEIGG